MKKFNLRSYWFLLAPEHERGSERTRVRENENVKKMKYFLFFIESQCQWNFLERRKSWKEYKEAPLGSIYFYKLSFYLLCSNECFSSPWSCERKDRIAESLSAFSSMNYVVKCFLLLCEVRWTSGYASGALSRSLDDWFMLSFHLPSTSLSFNFFFSRISRAKRNFSVKVFWLYFETLQRFFCFTFGFLSFLACKNARKIVLLFWERWAAHCSTAWKKWRNGLGCANLGCGERSEESERKERRNGSNNEGQPKKHSAFKSENIVMIFIWSQTNYLIN